MAEDRVVALIVDDHPVVLAGVEAVLATHPRITDVFHAATVAEALSAAAEQQPGLVILDVNLNEESTLPGLPDLKAVAPGARIVVYTAYASVAIARAAFAAGADGFLPKQSASDQLIPAVDAVLGGGRYASPAMLGALLGPQDVVENLTERERAVLVRYVRGLTRDRVAAQLDVSVRTVDNHLASIRVKTGAVGREALADVARRLGFPLS